jgi:hypothetical protein
MILRDSNGNIIFSACRNLLRCNNALEAEVQSCLEGLELALQYSQLPIIVDINYIHTAGGDGLGLLPRSLQPCAFNLGN